MKNEFTLAFNEVLEEKQLPKDVIVKALESAMVSAYRRAVNASNAQHVDATVDIETGKVTILAEKEVVESVQDIHTEVTLEEAHRYNPEAQLGDMVIVESTPKDFGRVAAQTARQVIQQRIRDAERQAQIDHFEGQIGEIVTGVIQAVNAQGLTIGMEMKAEGSMPRKELIPGERFRIHDRVRALLSEVKDSPRGPQIILSRTHRNFLRRLLETEVPEIYRGVVEIRSIAREPGQRAKVAVSASQPGIDPVGACVGIRGVRIQAIVRELHDEKIDVIEWNADPAIFISKAISPARVTGVFLNERAAGGKTATVVVPEDQLSLAIGRDGQNARLAAKLTSWRIDIKSLPEAAGDTLTRLKSDPGMASIAEAEASHIEAIASMLERKAEGRALTPEEYDEMGKFVSRVENRSSGTRAPESKAEDSAASDIRKQIPEKAFITDILDSGLPEHVAYILQEAGYSTSGELAQQMKVRPDDILRINGIGSKAMAEIQKLVERLDQQRADEITAEAAQAAQAAVEAAAVPEPEAAVVVEEAVALAEPVVEETVAVVVDETSAEKPVVEEEASLEVIFSTAVLETPAARIPAEDEEEEEDSTGKPGGKKSKKKKKSHVQVEYDPDKDATIVHRQHKRGDAWEDWNV